MKKKKEVFVSVPFEEYVELFKNPNTIELDDDGNILLRIGEKTFKKEDFLNNPQGLNDGRFICDSKTAYRIALNNTGLGLCRKSMNTIWGSILDEVYIYGHDTLLSVIKEQEETINKYEKNWFVKWFLKE